MSEGWRREAPDFDLTNYKWEHNHDGDYVPKGSYHNMYGELLYKDGTKVRKSDNKRHSLDGYYD